MQRQWFSSSREWYLRQQKDIFVKTARKEDYRSRAAFKLAQIDEKYSFLAKAKLVVDLGAAPGGWSQVSAERAKHGNVIAVDLLSMQGIERVKFIRGNFNDPQVVNSITTFSSLLLGNDNDAAKVDVVLSDMAPNISGINTIDHLRSIELVQSAWNFAKNNLRSGGTFLAKVFQGSGCKDLEMELKQHQFKLVKWIKPEASRKESSEIFIIALRSQ